MEPTFATQEIYVDVLQFDAAVLQTGDTPEYKVSGAQITSPYNLQLYCSSLWLDIQHLQLIKTKVTANILTGRKMIQLYPLTWSHQMESVLID